MGAFYCTDVFQCKERPYRVSTYLQHLVRHKGGNQAEYFYKEKRLIFACQKREI